MTATHMGRFKDIRPAGSRTSQSGTNHPSRPVLGGESHANRPFHIEACSEGQRLSPALPEKVNPGRSESPEAGD
jgi:hypothetical protein